MLFYAYDLEAYRDRIRGFYLDLERVAPGPLLATSDEVADGLRDIDRVRSAYSERYGDFVSSYCGLDDGHAAARVANSLLAG
jgi:CDP-glycerol glycerophosphotransferase